MKVDWIFLEKTKMVKNKKIKKLIMRIGLLLLVEFVNLVMTGYTALQG